jgi:hypothetical protein
MASGDTVFSSIGMRIGLQTQEASQWSAGFIFSGTVSDVVVSDTASIVHIADPSPPVNLNSPFDATKLYDVVIKEH